MIEGGKQNNDKVTRDGVKGENAKEETHTSHGCIQEKNSDAHFLCHHNGIELTWNICVFRAGGRWASEKNKISAKR